MLRVVHGTVFHGTKIPLQNLLARGNLQVQGSGHRLLGGWLQVGGVPLHL